jgi:hypothetical protein
MKICIELDEEMKSLLLFCFENDVIDFPSQFTTEEVEAIMRKQKQ